MGGVVGAHHLLGRAEEGLLILLVGPEYGKMQQMAATAGIKVRETHKVRNLKMVTAGVTLSGKSLALIASVPEVEGILDRSAFGPHLTDLAYAVDRIVYCGSEGGVLVHPQRPGTRIEIRQGSIQVTQEIAEVKPGETVIGLTVNHL